MRRLAILDYLGRLNVYLRKIVLVSIFGCHLHYVIKQVLVRQLAELWHTLLQLLDHVLVKLGVLFEFGMTFPDGQLFVRYHHLQVVGHLAAAIFYLLLEILLIILHQVFQLFRANSITEKLAFLMRGEAFDATKCMAHLLETFRPRLSCLDHTQSLLAPHDKDFEVEGLTHPR